MLTYSTGQSDDDYEAFLLVTNAAARRADVSFSKARPANYLGKVGNTHLGPYTEERHGSTCGRLCMSSVDDLPFVLRTNLHSKRVPSLQVVEMLTPSTYETTASN